MPSFSSLTEKVQTAQLMIGHTFDNPTIGMEALVTPGVALPGLTTRTDGHKELALVGDAVLKLALTLDGYEAKRSRGKPLLPPLLGVSMLTLYIRIHQQHPSNQSQQRQPCTHWA